MANTKSAKKMIKVIAKRQAINTARKSRIKTFINKLKSVIATGASEDAASEFKRAQSEIQRAVSRGAIKKNTAARKISRLSAKIKNMSGK